MNAPLPVYFAINPWQLRYQRDTGKPVGFKSNKQRKAGTARQSRPCALSGRYIRATSDLAAIISKSREMGEL